MLLAVGFTIMAVAWTGWRSIRDLEYMEHQLDLDPEPVVSRPHLRLLENTRAGAS